MTNPQGKISAPDTLAAGLRRVLANLLALQLQVKQAQWTVIGPDSELHSILDTVVENTMTLSDRIAGRIRELGGIPDGRAPTIVATADLTPFPLAEHTVAETAELVTGRLTTVVDAVRAVSADAPAHLSATTDLLHHVIEVLDGNARKIGAGVNE